jgi:UDP-N-acetylmuramoylalanine--D-glutamate ligase
MTRPAPDVLPEQWLRGEIAVVGLARSGVAAATLLARTGARVYASDAARTAELETTETALRGEGVEVELGGHDLSRLARSSLVVVSPGIPGDAPPLVAARNACVEIVSEIEIGLRYMPNLAYIAITGTNGKTTTTALTGQLLQGLGYDTVVAGNIGRPLTEVALLDQPPQWVALEVSSFQLHDTPGIAPRVGVLVNLSANHLDRYRGVEEYYADKALLFRNANANSRWVSNADDADVQRMVAHVPGEHCRFSVRERSDAYLDRDGDQLMVLGGPVIERRELALLGDHNVANVLAAILAVMMADPAHRHGDARSRIAETLRSFHALEHRIELVGEFDGAIWINDSKSTNVASTLVALRGMNRPTVVLLGGRHKGEPYTELIPELIRTGKQVIAYGEAAPLIEHDLKDAVPLVRLANSFDEVVQTARRMARPGDVVLLSPACSSYDMFKNYEERGAEFKRLAERAARGPGVEVAASSPAEPQR